MNLTTRAANLFKTRDAIAMNAAGVVSRVAGYSAAARTAFVLPDAGEDFDSAAPNAYLVDLLDPSDINPLMDTSDWTVTFPLTAPPVNLNIVSLCLASDLAGGQIAGIPKFGISPAIEGTVEFEVDVADHFDASKVTLVYYHGDTPNPGGGGTIPGTDYGSVKMWQYDAIGGETLVDAVDISGELNADGILTPTGIQSSLAGAANNVVLAGSAIVAVSREDGYDGSGTAIAATGTISVTSKAFFACRNT